MKITLIFTAALGLVVAVPSSLETEAKPKGIDVSSDQPNIDWPSLKGKGIEFAIIKATAGVTYKSPQFQRQYEGATNYGLIKGSYHFARPDESTGVDQANFFVNNGGGWINDGRDLPGTLNLEDNPYGGSNKCYGYPQNAMVEWIRDFYFQYLIRTARNPFIYTTKDWWNSCTGNNTEFRGLPLFIAGYGNAVGPLPAGWITHTFWQYADHGPVPGNQDLFNGNLAGLKKLVKGH